MTTDKGNMRTECVFSDDRARRYLLHKEWDGRKEKVMIIMTNPSTANIHSLDYTTLYIINNLLKLGVGGVNIVNLLSEITTKLSLKELPDKLEKENVQQIVKSAEKADRVIIAWGKCGDSSQKLSRLQDELLEKLEPHNEKLFEIADDNGRSGFHPLAPSIRFSWNLVPFWKEDDTDDDEAETSESE